jgi:hypothetical protein
MRPIPALIAKTKASGASTISQRSGLLRGKPAFHKAQRHNARKQHARSHVKVNRQHVLAQARIKAAVAKPAFILEDAPKPVCVGWGSFQMAMCFSP